MGELIVVTGPPGAGKSTVANALAARFEPSALVRGDDFFGYIRNGAIAPWLPEARAQNELVTSAAARAAGCLATAYTVVYEGVLGPWFLSAFIAATGLESVHYVVLLPSEQCCVTRVGTRLGHGFADPAATRQMHGEFARAAIAPRHLITETVADPEVLAAAIAERVAARSFVIGTG